MESSLTEAEMEAVLQLIHLSGNSPHDFRLFWLNFPASKEQPEQVEDEINREESVGETSSSSVINPDKSAEEEALPRRRRKFLQISDIYKRTQPLITNRAHKRP